MDKNELPKGWGENDENDEYGFDNFNDDEESGFPFKKSEEQLIDSAPDISSNNTEQQSEQVNQEQSGSIQQSDTSIKPVQTNQVYQPDFGKKSKAVPILICIIAVAGGILAGILILKNRKVGEKEVIVSETSVIENSFQDTNIIDIYDKCRVYDEKKLFSEEELSRLNKKLKETADVLEMNIAIYLSNTSRSEEETKIFTDNFYDNTLGINTDGVLYYMDLSEQFDYDYISTSGKAVSVYDGKYNEMFNIIYQSFPYSYEEINAPRIEQVIYSICNELIYRYNEYFNKSSTTKESLSYDNIISTEELTEEKTPTNVSDTYSADEISAMFSAYIAENPDPNRTYDNADYGYALIDLNNDGTQELLITEGEMEKGAPWIIGVYTIKNSNLTLLMGFDLRFPGSLYEDNIISCFSSLGQGGGTAFYKYITGDSLDMIDIISYDYSSGTKVMYHNSDVITEAESYSILAQYKAIKFEATPLNINLQQTVDSSINTSKYTTYDTSAAPADMYFYQGDYYDPLGRKAIGVIATETDPLNLRPIPSTEVPEIAKIPKGAQVFVLGYNDEWCYVEYYSGSETFFGYASRQYIDVDVYQIGVG